MRPRKVPPVFVPAGCKYCWKCQSVLPLASFATDRKQPDDKRMDCRRCDSAAANARDKARRAAMRLAMAA